MDPLSVLFTLIVLLGISGLLSAYEVAFFSLGEARREALLSQNPGRLWTHWLSFFHQVPEKTLAAILLGNTFVNIGITLLILKLSEILHWPYAELLASLSALLSIILLGELLPKAMAISAPETTLRLGTLLVQLVFLIAYPLILLLERLRSRFEKNLPLACAPETLLEVLENLPKESIPKIEQHTLRNLLLLRTLPVKSFMISRVDMKSIPISHTWDQVKATFQELPYIRIPVHGENLDDIRGVLYLKDLLRYWENDKLENWQGLLRPVTFVPESKKAYAVFMDLRANRQHLAIVVDEYGTVAGVITLQRLLEIVFGYGEEEQNPDTGYEVQPDGSIIFQANAPLLLVRSLLELPDDFFERIEARQAENLADFLLSLTGHIPKKGEIISYDDYVFEVLEVTGYRMDRIRAYRCLSKPDLAPTEGLS